MKQPGQSDSLPAVFLYRHLARHIVVAVKTFGYSSIEAKFPTSLRKKVGENKKRKPFCAKILPLRYLLPIVAVASSSARHC